MSMTEAPDAEAEGREADLIVTTTTAALTILEAAWIQQARCLCSLGANSLARSELDPRIVTAARLVVFDSREVAELEGGSLLETIENGKLLWSQVTELGELLLPHNTEKIVRPKGTFDLFCSHGLAAQDLYVAHQVYKSANEKAASFESVMMCA